MGRIFKRIDWVSGICILCLASFGLFLLLTVDQTLFLQQLLFLVIALLFLVGISLIDWTLLWWMAPAGYVGSILFLFLSYFGPSILARFLTQYSPRNVRFVPLHMILFLIPFFLVLKQPDLGSSLVYGGLWISMLVASGFPFGFLVVFVALGALLLPFGWHALAVYQKSRILTFLNPALDPRGAGYNALQAMIAVGSGQLFGRGLGRGTQSHLRFLPEFHTDFMFATLIEELGFVGGALLLAGYGFLLWRILSPLVRGSITDAFPFIYSIGLFATILTQIFINTGMNMGLIPITGITLPFVSYGGSSLLSLAISFGFLWALQQQKRQRTDIAIR
ncbi:FtsW/RodA/SpoVE family cell cycle protein [Candidatus Gottesmanbacteria bacterium]|nr:FtsW/RodA/SpoVE family cell cycle protein [Candidatus Gottesmanbacteria bacterium]